MMAPRPSFLRLLVEHLAGIAIAVVPPTLAYGLLRENVHWWAALVQAWPWGDATLFGVLTAAVHESLYYGTVTAVHLSLQRHMRVHLCGIVHIVSLASAMGACGWRCRPPPRLLI